MSHLYMQYGCGLSAPASWRNFDSSPTLRLQRIPLAGSLFRGGSFPGFPDTVEFGDIVRGLPVPSASCRIVYCSHVLEHLALDDLRTALSRTRTYLEPGGTFRFVLPDLEFLARTYLAAGGPLAAVTFVKEMNLGRERQARGLRGLAREGLGSTPHKWMWDYPSVRAELESAGFREIRRAQFGDNPEPKLRDVEDPDRWTHCLGIECVR